MSGCGWRRSMAKNLKGETEARLLSPAPEDKAFFLVGGKVLCTEEDLARAFAEMSDEQFSSHHNHEKNDFYNWVSQVIGDSRLAHDLALAKTRETSRKKAEARVQMLKNIVNHHGN